MTQKREQSIKDAEKKRREYLRKKLYAGALLGIWVLVALCCSQFSIILISSMFLPDPDTARHVALAEYTKTALPWLSGLFGILGMILVHTTGKRMKAIPHVPPVREQVTAMPAESILVRASDRSTAEPNELLRGAHSGTGLGSQELLRPEPTPTEETLEQIGNKTV